jgi:hypothetical protein
VVPKENIAALWVVFLFIFTKLSLHVLGRNVNNTLLFYTKRCKRQKRPQKNRLPVTAGSGFMFIPLKAA